MMLPARHALGIARLSACPCLLRAGEARQVRSSRARSAHAGASAAIIHGGPGMAGRLGGKVALVTGAASGIGAATAALFAREGASVARADLTMASLEAVASDVESTGREALLIAADVTKRADTERLVRETVARFGRVDVLVNSAGVAPRNAPPDWDWEQVWDFVMTVNMKGTFLMCRAVVDQMVQQGGGSIVN